MTEEQNKNVKKWLAALRSGDYEQGRGRLKQSRGRLKSPQYCCLGVACVVLGLEFDEHDALPSTSTSLPFEALPELGLRDCEGDFAADSIPGNKHTSLISMNDAGCSFSEIADVIELQLSHIDTIGADGLFTV